MIYHLAEQAHWDQALRSGSYARSTRGLSLEDVGFIHASSAEQWPVVRRTFFADLEEPLVLLHIDESRLAAPVVDEVGAPETGELFPHVYGPINVDAVVETTLLGPPHA
jgi:glutathione S-transferase